MLAKHLYPTALLEPSERTPLKSTVPAPPSPFRWVTVIRHFAAAMIAVFLLWITGRLTRARYARRVRAFLENMGTLWVKTGQILAQRSDLLGTEFCNELAMIQDVGDAYPFVMAKAIIEEELGGSLSDHFSTFDERPFAATTISQTHRAHLRHENIPVAVKVQRPHALEMFTRDVYLIRAAVWLMEFFSVHRHMRWQDLFHELHEIMVRELDFNYEASSFKKLKKKLKKHRLYVPQSFPKYCTRRVLVTEYIQAALLSDYIRLQQSDPERLNKWLLANNIKPRKVARCLFNSVYRQIFEDNLFHGDMHPGNIILLRNSRLAVIDCRTVRSLEAESVKKHFRYLQALSKREFSTAAEIYFLLASRLPLVDIAEVKKRLVHVWRNWEARNYVDGLPCREKSVTQMFDELNELVFRYEFAVQWPMSKLIQALKNLDLSMSSLAGDVNYFLWLRRYLERADRRFALAPIDRQRAAQQLTQGVQAVKELPARIGDVILFQQTVVRRQAVFLSGTTSRIAEVLRVIYKLVGFALLLGIMFFVAAWLHQHAEPTALPRLLGPQIYGLVSRVPTIENVWWLTIVATTVMLRWILGGLQQRLAEKEADNSGTTPVL